MKTRKKAPTASSLDDVIAKGQATIQEEPSKKPQGRPKNKVPKKQCPFYLPDDIILAIDENCSGNKSVFAEKVFRFYFKQHDIDI